MTITKPVPVLSPSTVLARIAQVKAALAEVEEPAEAAQLVAKAEALTYLVKKAQLSEEAQHAAAEVALRAKRRAGELLAATVPHEGGRPKKQAQAGPVSPRPPALDELGIDRHDSQRWQAIAAVPEERFERYLADAEVAEPTTAGLLRTAHVSFNGGESEWYTPTEIIEAARAVMGGIDLDPASTPEANEVVKAEHFYTIEDDGLAQPWYGRVWLNPPYSQPAVARFVERLIDDWGAGELEQACCLVNNATETGWGQLLLYHANAVCFISGRVKFRAPGGEPGAPLQGQVLAYFGPAEPTFEDLGVTL
jgi:ParB family chromosome partitioning protein